MFIDILKTDTTFHWVDSMFVYSNTCTAPNLLCKYGRPVGQDSVTGIELRAKPLTIGSTYYIRIKLKITPTYSIKYALNIISGVPVNCNLITNGDFETTAPGWPCGPIVYGLSGYILPGTFEVPSWESGGEGMSRIISTTTMCASANPYYPSPLYHPSSAHSGVFMAMVSSATPTSSPIVTNSIPGDDNSYLRTTFSTPLSALKKYYVQMFYEVNPTSLFLTDGLGMYISVGAPTNTNVSVISNSTYWYTHISPTCTPQIKNPPGNLITNYTWLPMGGVYTASAAGGEDHLTIGNFTAGSLTAVGAGTCTFPCGGEEYAIDDISITPLSLNIATPPVMCNGNSAQLNVSTCIPPYCTASYTWSPSAGLSNPNILNPVASPTTNTTYTLTQVIANATGSAVVTTTAVITMTVNPYTFTFTSGANSDVICTNLGQSAVNLTATSTAAASYTWWPGGLLGGTQSGVTPTANTVYTVTASYNGCTFTQTTGITISSVCCTSTVGAITQANVNGAFISGPAVINQDLTIMGNAISQFQNGEFQIAPNVKINILGGSQLQLRGAHLYACSSKMWQGIIVNNNSRLASSPTASNTTLIEDAIIAVTIDNINSVPTMSVIELNGAIFNKNYVAISISNATTNVVPCYMVGNIFTSRTLTFTSTQWPSNTTLNAVTNPTTGILAPYVLQNFPFSNLKSPYTTQPGQAGVMLTNVGNTTGSPSFGTSLGESNTNGFVFNLFDGMYFGMYATNSNLNSVNNVFQNMKMTTVLGNNFGGIGIYSGCTTLMNNQLNLNDPYINNSISNGNRFWDCYYGVVGNNLFKFTAEYSLFRSSQSNQSGSGVLPGNTGVYLGSNRFGYYIRGCSFGNLRYGINIGIVSGTYNVGTGIQTGIFESNIYIGNNYFGAEPSTTMTIANEYMNTAVSVSCPNNIPWNALSNSGLFVQSNNMNRVFRGVSVNGMNSYTTTINTNSIVLVTDMMNGGTQRGIELVNTLGSDVVLTNTVSGVDLTNTLTTLVFCANNAGASSPSVCCNHLFNGYKGFEFNASNSNTIWNGNTMNNLGKGLFLSSNGIIGPQGSTSISSDNQWASFAVGTNGTWTDNTSNAASSKLYINNLGGAWYPPSNNGFFFNQSYGFVGPPPNIITSSTATPYSCASQNAPPPVALMVAPVAGNDASVDQDYSAGTTMFRALAANPVLLDSSEVLSNFYDSVSVGTIGTFKKVETQLYTGQMTTASGLNAAVSPTNNVESNYQLYYQLYTDFAANTFSSADSSSLYYLASLCAGNYGASVYQARALYNFIYKTVLNVNEDCDALQQGSRLFKTNVPKANVMKAPWSIELYPNPSTGQLSLLNHSETDLIEVIVKDVYGRMIWSKNIPIRNYTADFNLTATEGIYMVTLKNSSNECVTKKLVITN